MSLLDKIMPTGFAKCAVDDGLTIDYASPKFIENSGLTDLEFTRRCHNSLAECIVSEDRANVMAAIGESAATGAPFDCDCRLYYGFYLCRLLYNLLNNFFNCLLLNLCRFCFIFIL